MMFSSSLPRSGFVAKTGLVSNTNPYEAHFNCVNNRKTYDYGDGMVAIPIVILKKKTGGKTQEETARANMLSFFWTPKGSTTKYPQRCPSVWVDNFLFLYTRDMAEPHLLLGRWKKTVDVYGQNTSLEGLVVAAGGHYERMGNKKGFTGTNIYGSQIYLSFEDGDMSLKEAADKEIKEEVGIDPKLIRASREFGLMDDVFGDPRCHGIRYITLRWVEQMPKASEELKDIVAIPVSQLSVLYGGTSNWRFPDGKECGLILGHDKLIRYVIEHPDVIEFLSLIATFYQKYPEAIQRNDI